MSIAVQCYEQCTWLIVSLGVDKHHVGTLQWMIFVLVSYYIVRVLGLQSRTLHLHCIVEMTEQPMESVGKDFTGLYEHRIQIMRESGHFKI